MKDVFEKYEDVKQHIFDYFGYVEDWRVFPLVFDLDMYWAEDGEQVVFSEDIINLTDEDCIGNHYSNEIFKQRHLSKWVYRAKDYTMIVVDTHTDGNQFLQVLDNSKEVKANILAFDY